MGDAVGPLMQSLTSILRFSLSLLLLSLLLRLYCVRHLLPMVIGERRNRDEASGDDNEAFPMPFKWSCGSGHHFSHAEPGSVRAGERVDVAWEGGSQVIDEGRQFVHAIGVYLQPRDEGVVPDLDGHESSKDEDGAPKNGDGEPNEGNPPSPSHGPQIGRIRDGRARRLSRFLRDGVLTLRNCELGDPVKITKSGPNAGRVEGFAIVGEASTTLSIGDPDYNELVLACGPSRMWRRRM